MIATRITYLIFMISYENSMIPFIHAKHVECNYFPLPSKFKMPSHVCQVGVCNGPLR
jgi:hypothetical protein